MKCPIRGDGLWPPRFLPVGPPRDYRSRGGCLFHLLRGRGPACMQWWPDCAGARHEQSRRSKGMSAGKRAEPARQSLLPGRFRSVMLVVSRSRTRDRGRFFYSSMLGWSNARDLCPLTGTCPGATVRTARGGACGWCPGGRQTATPSSQAWAGPRISRFWGSVLGSSTKPPRPLQQAGAVLSCASV